MTKILLATVAILAFTATVRDLAKAEAINES
jgi:hypothetical protein